MSNLRLPENVLDLTDYDLGGLILGLFIVAQAEEVGIPPTDVPDEFGNRVIEYVLGLKADSARLAPLEMVLHTAAGGDFEKAGKIMREDLTRGVMELKFVPLGIQKFEQAKEFGQRGAESNKAIGEANREAVLAAANAILADRERRPSDRQLASEIANKEEINMKESTVRSHIRALRKEDKMD